MKTPLSFRDQALCRGLAEMLLKPLQVIAIEHGYALAMHGSRLRDIDLIAVPWTSEARDPIVLAEAIRAEAERLVGIAAPTQFANREYFWRGSRGAKPHGRLVWSFHLGSGPYIDLSVMRPWADPHGDNEILPKWHEGQEPKSHAELAAMNPIPPMASWKPRLD